VREECAHDELRMAWCPVPFLALSDSVRLVQPPGGFGAGLPPSHARAADPINPAVGSSRQSQGRHLQQREALSDTCAMPPKERADRKPLAIGQR